MRALPFRRRACLWRAEPGPQGPCPAWGSSGAWGGAWPHGGPGWQAWPALRELPFESCFSLPSRHDRISPGKHVTAIFWCGDYGFKRIYRRKSCGFFKCPDSRGHTPLARAAAAPWKMMVWLTSVGGEIHCPATRHPCSWVCLRGSVEWTALE